MFGITKENNPVVFDMIIELKNHGYSNSAIKREVDYMARIEIENQFINKSIDWNNGWS